MSIEIVNESGSVVDELALVSAARFVLEKMGVSPLAELSISLQDEAEMTRLHEQYMDLPGPTDVLAFPQDDLDLRGALGVSQGTVLPDDDVPPTLLGDVVLCPEVAAEQAVTAGHALADELQLLTTHGVLHLLGYDHEEPDEHVQMFALQAELLASWQTQKGPSDQSQPDRGPSDSGLPDRPPTGA